MDDRSKMQVSGCIGVRLVQAYPEVYRQVFDQPGGGTDERCLEIRQCLANSDQQRVSMLGKRCQQAGQSLAVWFLRLAADPPRQGARCNVHALLDAFFAWGSCSSSFTSVRNGPQSCSDMLVLTPWPRSPMLSHSTPHCSTLAREVKGG